MLGFKSSENASVVEKSFNPEARTCAIANHNKRLAVALARAGIPVFPCKQEDKTPLPLAWERLDTSISPDEREAKRRAFHDKHGFEPFHIGCTLDTALIRKWFRDKPTAVPAISCGVAGLFVIDNDRKIRHGSLKNGVELFDAFCAEQGGLPTGVVAINSQGGGRHLYFAADRTNPLGCDAGLLKPDCESDVKGCGGYVIAPSAIRGHDGKRYGSKADLDAFLNAYKEKRLVTVPQFIRNAIGSKPEGVKVMAEQWAQPLKDLAEKEWPDYAETFGDPALDAKYDIAALMRRDRELKEVMESPSGDRSTDRWKIARRLLFLCPDLAVDELATFYAEHADIAGELTADGKGTGNYSLTDIGKEWVKNRIAVEKGEVKAPASKGESFEAVDDESDANETQSDSSKTYKAPKIENWYTNATFVPVDLDIDVIAPRPYIYGTYLQRGHVTLLSASGGVGKSAWSLSVGIDLACGADHLGAGDFKRRNVLVYNAEDDTQEMLRRAGAYMRFHNFTTEMRRNVRSNLTIISGVNGALQFADYRDGRVVIIQNSVTLFKQILRERQIEVAMLDPLVGLHNIPENANSEMNKLIMEIKAVTATSEIATLVSHHDKKNIGGRDVEDASQDDARGAGTITTPMRVVLSMKRLSKSDIKRLRIPAEDVSRVIALSKGAKSNYSARDTSSRLFFSNSVQANNGSEEFKADSTVALCVYKLRAAGPQITGIQRDAILAEIAKGDFRSDAQANGAIVQFITDIAGVDSDADGKRYVNELLSEWVKRGWVIVEKAKIKGHKREVPVYKRGPGAPPAAEIGFEPVEDEDE